MSAAGKARLLYFTIAPPENHSGARLVMHRHLVERQPFDFLTATDTSYATTAPPHLALRLPKILQRLQRTRLHRWIKDFRNLVWPWLPNATVDQAIRDFRPDIILALADNCLCKLATRAARKHRLPVAGLFLDWVPIMDGHFGHRWTQPVLSRQFRAFYPACDLAFCTSDGMQEVLGRHPNSHVLYPMPGRHAEALSGGTRGGGKFRLVYVGSVQRFYGRMLASLVELLAVDREVEIVVVGPGADWPDAILKPATRRGAYLGYKPPEEAAAILNDADALLVTMSFEPDYELFMRTSFTTKFLDYSAYGKPIVLWGPPYCTPVKVARRDGGALVVEDPAPAGVVDACRSIRRDDNLRSELSVGATRLRETVFNPDRLQQLFVGQLEKLVQCRKASVSGVSA